MINTKIKAEVIKEALAGRYGVVPSINDGNSPFKLIERDSEMQPLEPGAMYCKAIEDFDGNISYGSLVRYCTDGNFYNVDEGDTWEEDNGDYDFLVRQVGGIDGKYVFEEVAVKKLAA